MSDTDTGYYSEQRLNTVIKQDPGIKTDKPAVYITPSFIDEITQRNQSEMEKYKIKMKDERDRNMVRYYLGDVYSYAWCKMDSTSVSKLSEKEFSMLLRKANRRYLFRFAAALSWPVASCTFIGAGIWAGIIFNNAPALVFGVIAGFVSTVIGVFASPISKYYKILKRGVD